MRSIDTDLIINEILVWLHWFGKVCLERLSNLRKKLDEFLSQINTIFINDENNIMNQSSILMVYSLDVC